MIYNQHVVHLERSALNISSYLRHFHIYLTLKQYTGVMLTEISQTQKDNDYIILLI